MKRILAIGMTGLGLAIAGTEDAAAQARGAASGPESSYWVYVGAESADLIHRIRFGPGGAEVEKTTVVGLYAVEMEGPHGLKITPDGRHLLMTTGHGLPDGMFWRFELGPDTVVNAPIPLGRFPATVDVTPDGLYAFIVNFNLHGEMVPSTVSVVYTPDMVEVDQIETCTMPHGSRVDPSGTRHYSACMMDDQIVEIDTRSFQVSRRFRTAKGDEGPVTLAAHAGHGEPEGHAAHQAAAGPRGGRPSHEPSCSPTWAEPSPDGRRVYVACNRSDEVLEISAAEWTLTRRFTTGRGPYNLAVTPDGRTLVITLKQGGQVQFIDLATGESRAIVGNSTTVTHGVVVSPDSRYAFVSVEGVGAEPGKVDIFDLRTFRLVDSVEVGQQASGITFWKME